MQQKCKIWQNGYPQTRVVEPFKCCIMNITPVNIAVCNQKGVVGKSTFTVRSPVTCITL